MSKKQLTALKQGPEFWNSWRAKHPNAQPNFGGADLNSAPLRRADLHGANLVGQVFARQIFAMRTFGGQSSIRPILDLRL
jgi:uncharacterized protein YjbI with pentapeptide repeats